MQGTRWFFFASLVVTAVLVIMVMAGTLPSDEIPQEVAQGYEVWQANNCAGCHTLYGQGGNYAPDLTHIHSQRGATYIADFLVAPSAYHPDQRFMPRFGLTRTDAEDLLAFLGWIDTHEAGNDFPPRTIVVSGGNLSFSSANNTIQGSDENSPVALGFQIYSQRCASCHTLTDARGIGPGFLGIADRAWYRVIGESAEQYIRNSIVNPGDYVVEGYPNVMAPNLGESLSSDDLNHVIAFLMTLEEPE